MQRPKAKAIARNSANYLSVFWTTAFLILGLLFVSFAQADEKITKSHGISTFGELKYPADFKHWDYVNPDAPQGGTISFLGTGASGTFDSLNQFILKGEPAQGLGLLYDSLLTSSSDEPDSAYGYVAETIEYPENRSWVIFNMRPEATFSDGHPITAQDVVFTYNILLEKGHPAYQIILKDFESVEALNDHRVKFTFKEGASTRDLATTAGGLSILPEHYYETKDFAESGLDIPVVSGRYLPTEVSPGRSIKYCKIENYWGADLPHNKGSGNFECYLYEYFADRTVALEAFKAGAFLFHEEFFSKLWASAYDFPAIRKGWVKKESIPDNRPSGTQGFWFNTRKEKFSDPRVRQAIGMAFNFEWSNKALFSGLYTRTDSFWENSPMQAEGVPKDAELALLQKYADILPDGVLTDPAFTPAKSKPNQADRRIIRKANKLLDAAGWTVASDGIRRNAKGEKLTLEFIDDSPSFERIINPFLQNLERIGLEVSFNQVDKAQMQQRQEDFDFDMIGGRLVMSLSPGEELFQIFGSSSATVAGTPNYSGVAHPAVDAMIEVIRAAKSREEMETAVRALDRILRSLHIWVPNWYKASHNIAYWDVFGRPETKPLYSRGVIGTWWMDQEKLTKLKSDGALR